VGLPSLFSSSFIGRERQQSGWPVEMLPHGGVLQPSPNVYVVPRSFCRSCILNVTGLTVPGVGPSQGGARRRASWGTRSSVLLRQPIAGRESGACECLYVRPGTTLVADSDLLELASPTGESLARDACWGHRAASRGACDVVLSGLIASSSCGLIDCSLIFGGWARSNGIVGCLSVMVA